MSYGRKSAEKLGMNGAFMCAANGFSTENKDTMAGTIIQYQGVFHRRSAKTGKWSDGKRPSLRPANVW